MKYILLLFLLISSSVKAEKFTGYYITNNLDTVDCAFDIPRRYKNTYDFSYVTRSVILSDQEGMKRLKPNKIVGFSIYTPDKGVYKFVSLKKDRKQFFNEIVSGKISLYKLYSRHAYDGSLIIIPIAIKDNKLVYLNTPNRKRKLAALFKDNPAVLEKWQAIKFNAWTDSWSDTEEMESCIREYNEVVEVWIENKDDFMMQEQL